MPISPDGASSLSLLFDSQHMLHGASDGSCMQSDYSLLSAAAWSSCTDTVDKAKPLVDASFLHGLQQSVNRAELFAFLVLCIRLLYFSFVAALDSQYVID